MQDISTTITPRFYETDALGHINNATIAAWFEIARMKLLESLGDEGAESARSWILASLHIDFVAETFYGADVTATITAASLGNSSLTVECEMTQRSETTVRGTAVLVHMDVQAKSSARIPDKMRRQIEAL